MSIVQRFDDWLAEETSPRRALLTYAALAFYFIILLFPVVYLVLATFLTQDALFSGGYNIVPTAETFTLRNWEVVLSESKLPQFMINSTIVATATTLLTLSVSIIGAYSISRYDYPGSQYIVLGFVSTQMLPFILILIPFFSIMFTLELIDTYIGIILAHSVGSIPFALWLLKGYFDDIPEALDEAAKLDGCSEFDVLFRIILPLSIPGISVGGFYTFILSWNEFIAVSVLSQSDSTRTLPFALFLFQNGSVVDWGATLTVAVVTMTPVILLFALVQQYVVEGLATGGTKGV